MPPPGHHGAGAQHRVPAVGGPQAEGIVGGQIFEHGAIFDIERGGQAGDGSGQGRGCAEACDGEAVHRCFLPSPFERTGLHRAITSGGASRPIRTHIVRTCTKAAELTWIAAVGCTLAGRHAGVRVAGSTRRGSWPGRSGRRSDARSPLP